MDKKELGNANPKSLQFTIFFLVGKRLGFRGRESFKQILFGDLELKEDSCGRFYLEYSERATKTRDGTDVHHHYRDTAPRIYEDKTLGNRDPIILYKEYISRRPLTSNLAESPLFLTPIPENRLLPECVS